MKKLVWYDSTIWLTFTALGFLGPVIAGIVIRLALGAGLTIEWVTGGGQFAVSSAGLLMTTMYFVARPGQNTRLPFTEVFVLLFVIGLLAGITLFALATLRIIEAPIDPRFYQWPSILLFGAALVTAYIAVGLDKTRDIENSRFLEDNTRANREDTEEAFDATFG